jgi:two-component system response regulator HydG
MGESVKVLVVDDDRRMVKTICDILKTEGIETATAFTGEEAVETVRAERPDCVLMDIRMPGIDGVEALRMMKQQDFHLPVVLMSANASSAQTEAAKCNGAYSVLTKPIDLQQILSFFSLLKREKSILIVDEDPQFSKTLKDIFQSRNYQVETEDDPEKVLGRMERKYEMVVVLDLNLRATDGLEILQNIRKRYPTKPVVLVTSCREEMTASIEKGLRIGAYTCLYKPLATEELIGIIKEIRQYKLRSFLVGTFQEQDNGHGQTSHHNNR